MNIYKVIEFLRPYFMTIARLMAIVFSVHCATRYLSLLHDEVWLRYLIAVPVDLSLFAFTETVVVVSIEKSEKRIMWYLITAFTIVSCFWNVLSILRSHVSEHWILCVINGLIPPLVVIGITLLQAHEYKGIKKSEARMESKQDRLAREERAQERAHVREMKKLEVQEKKVEASKPQIDLSEIVQAVQAQPEFSLANSKQSGSTRLSPEEQNQIRRLVEDNPHQSLDWFVSESGIARGRIYRLLQKEGYQSSSEGWKKEQVGQ